MKTLVQDRINGSYAGTEGRWVGNLGEAAWFPSTADALFYCVNRQLHDVQLLVADSATPSLTPPDKTPFGVITLPILDSELNLRA